MIVLSLAATFIWLLPAGAQATDNGGSARPAEGVLARLPWEYGAFVNGGFGTANRDSYKFLWAGLHAGKVLTDPFGKGLLRGQFELAAELMPLWQAYTPKYLRANCYAQPGGPLTCSNLFPTGGTYTGVSVTPVILRWNLRWRPSLPTLGSGCGRPDLDQSQVPAGWSVSRCPTISAQVFLTYTPQFGVGVHYFVKPRQSISISANAVHISNASLGDSNPGRQCKRAVLHWLYVVEIASR